MAELKTCRCDNYEGISSNYGEFIIHRIDYDKFQISDGLTNREEQVIFKHCPHCGGVLDIEKYRDTRATEPPPRALTIEELNDLIGRPVWIKDLTNNEIELLRFDETYKPEGFNDFDYRFQQFGTEIGIIRWKVKYGKTWLAYAVELKKGC